MSRILDALKEIEGKLAALRKIEGAASLSSAEAIASETEEPTRLLVPVRRSVGVAGQAPELAVNADDGRWQELHPVVLAELDEIGLSRGPAKPLEKHALEQAGTPMAAVAAPLIDESLARAESAVEIALCAEQADVYHQMAQYVFSAIMTERTVLLFTSPGENVEKLEILFQLSKSLLHHNVASMLVFDAENDGREIVEGMPCAPGFRYEPMGDFSDDWAVLLGELKTRFELVLVNAPSLADARAAELIAHCDGVYLAIGLGYARPSEVRKAQWVIEQAGGRLLGCIAVG